MKDQIVSQPTAWRVRCYDSKDKLHHDRMIFQPLPEYERLNLSHHFTLVIDEYALVEAAKSASSNDFIAAQIEQAG